jgi:four helix bundle protein
VEKVKIKQFEDLLVWQKARALTKAIHLQTSSGKLSRDFGLCDQLQRSAVSVMSNIAEGFEHQSTAEYIRFLGFAKSSCGELRSRLYPTLDVGYSPRETFDQLYNQAEEVSRLLAALKSALLRRKQS